MVRVNVRKHRVYVLRIKVEKHTQDPDTNCTSKNDDDVDNGGSNSNVDDDDDDHDDGGYGRFSQLYMYLFLKGMCICDVYGTIWFGVLYAPVVVDSDSEWFGLFRCKNGAVYK